MNFFEEATLRLKQQLAVTQDKEVASYLGLSPRAWAGRKQSENFPEVELYALAAKRPDLKINVDYVLTGRMPQVMTPEGRDDFIDGKLAAQSVMLQALLLAHPQAKAVHGIYMQRFEDVRRLAGETAGASDLIRGLEAGHEEFRLLADEISKMHIGQEVASPAAAAKPEAMKTPRTRKAA